ncbi:hypothetical protein DINM_020784 [Dirofilaria immitis]|nr:hypothetical protein [Dirofilaria immitis]
MFINSDPIKIWITITTTTTTTIISTLISTTAATTTTTTTTIAMISKAIKFGSSLLNETLNDYINSGNNDDDGDDDEESTRKLIRLIFSLSVVDFLVIMHLPFLINDLLYGQWLFGKVMCKFYWFGESVNKLLSSFIMTVLSWDRYLAVCSPIKSIRMRRTMVACIVLLLCSALAIILLLPVVMNATVVHVDVHTGSLVMTNENNTFHSDHHHHQQQHYYHHQHITQTKCVFEESNPTFMYYTFACGFVLPALLITYFYLNVIIRLHKSVANVNRHSFITKQQNANMRIRQVSWSTLTLSSTFFAAHLLVCFNSAVNPILYALINRELRQQHTKALTKRCRSLSNATTTALDALIKHSHHLMEYTGPLHNNYDATNNYDDQNHIRKEKDNSHSQTTVVMQLCSFSNPRITIDNDNDNDNEHKMDSSTSSTSSSTHI